MATRYYTAIVEKEADSDYGVFFPDLPGCVSAGHTLDEAIRNAEEALSLHVEGMLAEGQDLPDASDIDAIALEADVQKAAIIVVKAVLPGRAQRVQITLDEALLALIDRTATDAGMNRSAWLADAARRRLEGRAGK